MVTSGGVQCVLAPSGGGRYSVFCHRLQRVNQRGLSHPSLFPSPVQSPAKHVHAVALYIYTYRGGGVCLHHVTGFFHH